MVEQSLSGGPQKWIVNIMSKNKKYIWGSDNLRFFLEKKHDIIELWVFIFKWNSPDK